MHPSPGKALFFADIKEDDAGPCGVTLHPERVFTSDDLETYSPGCTTHLSAAQQRRIIKAHENVAHLFKPPDPKDPLKWPFKYIHPTAPNPPYIITLKRAIRSIPTKSRHKQFSLNIFARLPEPWFNTLTQIITISFEGRRADEILSCARGKRRRSLETPHYHYARILSESHAGSEEVQPGSPAMALSKMTTSALIQQPWITHGYIPW